MKKIGLALSGGGFRASLYHLGLVRFLRDAGILPQVTHITSVSGGSILAAHLVLNWDRYNGSPSEFDAAASELIDFVRLDVRNRITRRFPLSIPLRWPRRMLGLSNRKLTRTGLMESYYETHLYGDKSLFELPERPQLHLLTTNLSEGCLCSFNRNGLFSMSRKTDHKLRINRVHVGLATVAMAVTASSAFPGFFPPLELTGADVGANLGEFGRQSFTDGGVFDNLGVRMFRCLERPLLLDNPFSSDDFIDFGEVVKALHQAELSGEDTPLYRTAQIMAASRNKPQPVSSLNDKHFESEASGNADGAITDSEAIKLNSLWKALRYDQLYRESSFANLTLADSEAESLHALSRAGQDLDAGDQLWLNRHLFESAYRQATGHNCFRRLNSGLDGVLVSDVGKPISVLNNRRAGGLIKTALRATDILMDRVWQLEYETFKDTPGFVFAHITDVVDQSQDTTALNPEIQRQTARIRTDLDRFSKLEIQCLIQHGYCVARKSVQTKPELFGSDFTKDPPWTPWPNPVRLTAEPSLKSGSPRAASDETLQARKMQASASRRIVSTLLDYRDWASYVYVPLIVPLLLFLPYFIAISYQRSHRMDQIINSLAQGSRDLERMGTLLQHPIEPWVGVKPEEIKQYEPANLVGFQILQDSRILDLRNWNPDIGPSKDPKSFVYGYQRLKVLRLPNAEGEKDFRLPLLPVSPQTQVRFPSQLLEPKLRVLRDNPVAETQTCLWEMSADFSKYPADESVDLIFEYLSPGDFLLKAEDSTTLKFEMQVETLEAIRWILLPQSREYRDFRIVRHLSGKPESVEAVQVVTQYLAEDSTILSYKILGAKAGYTYEVTWLYK